jgi:hypothetical protein
MSTTCDINVFISSLSANKEIRRKQAQLIQVLEVKKITFVKRDIASCDEDKADFKRLMKRLGDPSALPPQIFNGEQYCGNYELFYQAVEDNDLAGFLHLATLPSTSSSATATATT